MGFMRQEYWSGLPFPSAEDLPGPGIKPTSLVSPPLGDGFFTTEPLGKPGITQYSSFYNWFISLSIISLRFMYLIAFVRISFLLRAE